MIMNVSITRFPGDFHYTHTCWQSIRQDCYIEFHEIPTNGILADTRSRSDGTTFSQLREERLISVTRKTQS